MLRYYGDEAVKMYLRVNLSGSSLEQYLATISQTRTFLIKTNLKKNNKPYESLLGTSFDVAILLSHIRGDYLYE